LDLEDAGFFADVLQLMWVIAPAAAFYTLWRIWITNSGGSEIVFLGLDRGSSVYTESSGSYIPFRIRSSYFLVSVLTFIVGLVVSGAFKLLFDCVTDRSVWYCFLGAVSMLMSIGALG
jgi:hypothetical protein